MAVVTWVGHALFENGLHQFNENLTIASDTWDMDNSTNTTVGLLLAATLAGLVGALFGISWGASIGLVIVSFYVFGFVAFIGFIIKEFISCEDEIEPLQHDITPEGFVKGLHLAGTAEQSITTNKASSG